MADQNQMQFIHFINVQIAEIDMDKWIDSEKERRDLGRDKDGNPTDQYRHQWIATKGSRYRKKWDESCCKSCQCYGCTEQLKKECPDYTDNIRLHVVSQDNKMADFEVINIDNSNVLGKYYVVLQKKDDEIIPVFMKHED